MAWIKIEHTTPDKPEVFAMAEILGIDPDAVIGKLVRFWSWCDQQSMDGNAITVTQTFLDRITHQPGFSDALRNVGWLEVRSGSLQVPRFDRHNGQSAKARAENNRRVTKHRKRCNGETVTNVTQSPLQKPLPEKEREKEIVSNTHNARAHEVPTVEDVKAYAASSPTPISETCAVAFHDTQQAAGWITRHGHSIADWRAALRRYASVWNENEKAKAGHNGHKAEHRQQKAAAEYPEPKTKLPRL